MVLTKLGIRYLSSVMINRFMYKHTFACCGTSSPLHFQSSTNILYGKYFDSSCATKVVLRFKGIPSLFLTSSPSWHLSRA